MAVPCAEATEQQLHRFGVGLYSTTTPVYTSSWVTFRGTLLNVKIIANLHAVLKQAEAIKLWLLFLPHCPLFPPPFFFPLLCPLQSCLQVQLGNNIMSDLRIYCGIHCLSKKDFFLCLCNSFHGRHNLDSLWICRRGLREPLMWLLLFFCLFLLPYVNINNMFVAEVLSCLQKLPSCYPSVLFK